MADCGRDGRSREVRERELERALEREREEREPALHPFYGREREGAI